MRYKSHNTASRNMYSDKFKTGKAVSSSSGIRDH